MKKSYNPNEESKSHSQSKLSQYSDGDDKSRKSGVTGDSDNEEDDEDVELAIKSSDLIVRFH